MSDAVRLLTATQMEARMRLMGAELAQVRARLALYEREESRRMNGNRPMEIAGRGVARLLHALVVRERR